MHASIPFAYITERASFTLLIAPLDQILAAATLAFRRNTPPVRYLAGEEVGIFSRLISVHHQATFRHAKDGRHLLALIEEADRACLCIEHDPALFGDGPAFVERFVFACRDRAHEEGTTVLLLAMEADPVLLQVFQEADRAYYGTRLYRSKRNTLRGRMVGEDLMPGQQTLEAFR
ncbi:MAG TPA: hypothetical protein ENN85_07705 [Methanoculleus sp.]|nr:hypothetical protein [Methanoculleus sp.]